MEWSKSRCQRLWSLGSSRNKLPTSLIVTFKSEKNHECEDANISNKRESLPNERKMLNDIFFNQPYEKSAISSNSGKLIEVLGHIRLLPVPFDTKSCFFESMVVSPGFRGLGIGSFLIRAAEKYCENVLKLRRIYLSTYDAAVFYMKMDYEISPAVCIFGQGEVNTVTKQVYLKKTLDYEETSDIEDDSEIEEYLPKKDPNYNEQVKMECDVIFSGFPFRPDKDQVIADSFCKLFDTPIDSVKYFYSFEYNSKSEETKKFYFVLSFKSKEAKDHLMEKATEFGVICFQNLFEKPVNEYDNTLIYFTHRLTKLNLIIKKELIILKEENVISDWQFKDNIFYAYQNEDVINVCNLGILELLKMQDEPEDDEESIGWESPEELEQELKSMEIFKKQLKKNSLQGNEKYKWLAPIEDDMDESADTAEDSDEIIEVLTENTKKHKRNKNEEPKKKSRRESLSCFMVKPNSSNELIVENTKNVEVVSCKENLDDEKIQPNLIENTVESKCSRNDQTFAKMVEPNFFVFLTGLHM